jgi:hypothetical protein
VNELKESMLLRRASAQYHANKAGGRSSVFFAFFQYSVVFMENTSTYLAEARQKTEEYYVMRDSASCLWQRNQGGQNRRKV